MEASLEPIPKNSKLISRLHLTSTSIRRSDALTSNFAKYSPYFLSNTACHHSKADVLFQRLLTKDSKNTAT